jgi:hypothetical protein
MTRTAPNPIGRADGYRAIARSRRSPPKRWASRIEPLGVKDRVIMTSGVFTGPDLYRLMFGLLYPAVLGSFFFSLLPVLFGVRPEASERVAIGKTVAGCLVVFHFIVDFHLTSSLPAGRYSRGGFLVDLLILIALFRAFDSLNISRPTQQPSVRWVAAAMAFTYVLFIAWSFFTLEHIPGRLLVVEIMGLILFIVVAARRSVPFLCASLFLTSTTMAVIGSPIVGSLRDVRNGGTYPAKLDNPATREVVKAPPAGRVQPGCSSGPESSASWPLSSCSG